MKNVLKNRIVFALLFYIAALVTVALAGDDDDFQLPVQSKGDLSFAVDVCQFAGSENATAIEVYYAIDLNQFATQPADTNKTVNLSIHLALVSPANDTISSLYHEKSFSLSGAGRQAFFSFVDVQRFETVLDAATLLLSVTEEVSNRAGTVEKFFRVRRFTDALSISDPVLSSQVQKAGGNKTFEKSGLVIVPSVARSFSDTNNDSRMFAYFEINHLPFTEGKDSFYNLQYQVSNLKGESLIDESLPRLQNSGANSARVEAISLTGLKSGIYKLILHVTDLTTNSVGAAERYFTFDAKDGSDDLLLPMTAADEKKYLDQIKYIASEEEKKLFRQLSPRGKQQFLLEFWRSRDPDPQTADNEAMVEYFRRFAFCEKEFAGGINSDMGRIYISYGPPVEVVREFSKLEFTKPVEVWTYALDGKVEFVFVDRRRDGKYALVHSTHKDEFNNPNWQGEAQ
jgi:GWxTD domain-containing protein